MALMCSPDQVATQRAITAVDAEKSHTVISQADYNATKTAEQTKTGSVSYNELVYTESQKSHRSASILVC